ncbi:MAG: hypothetical protein ABH879_07390 [archaeon]
MAEKLELIREWIRKGIRNPDCVGAHVTSLERFYQVIDDGAFQQGTAFLPYGEAFNEDPKYQKQLEEMPGSLYLREDAIVEDVRNYYFVPVFLDYVKRRGLSLGDLEYQILDSSSMHSTLSLHYEILKRLMPHDIDTKLGQLEYCTRLDVRRAARILIYEYLTEQNPDIHDETVAALTSKAMSREGIICEFGPRLKKLPISFEDPVDAIVGAEISIDHISGARLYTFSEKKELLTHARG